MMKEFLRHPINHTLIFVILFMYWAQGIAALPREMDTFGYWIKLGLAFHLRSFFLAASSEQRLACQPCQLCQLATNTNSVHIVILLTTRKACCLPSCPKTCQSKSYIVEVTRLWHALCNLPSITKSPT